MGTQLVPPYLNTKTHLKCFILPLPTQKKQQSLKYAAKDDSLVWG